MISFTGGERAGQLRDRLTAELRRACEHLRLLRLPNRRASVVDHLAAMTGEAGSNERPKASALVDGLMRLGILYYFNPAQEAIDVTVPRLLETLVGPQSDTTVAAPALPSPGKGKGDGMSVAEQEQRWQEALARDRERRTQARRALVRTPSGRVGSLPRAAASTTRAQSAPASRAGRTPAVPPACQTPFARAHALLRSSTLKWPLQGKQVANVIAPVVGEEHAGTRPETFRLMQDLIRAGVITQRNGMEWYDQGTGFR